MKHGEKQIVVTLSLPVVAPLLDIVKFAADRMQGTTAAPVALPTIAGPQPTFRSRFSVDIAAAFMRSTAAL